ncbi:MAG: beta-ketoacyl-[acyl-carrier-protein] synthase family protein [Candidatus Binatia bacterium]
MANTTDREAEAYKSVDTLRTSGHPKVLITGMGCVTPFGAGVDRFWNGLVSGRSAIGPLTAFDPTPYGTKIAGEVRDFQASDFLSQREISGGARCVHFALASARMAIDDARLALKGVDTSRIGVFMGSSVGPMAYQAENHAVFLEKGIRKVHPFFPALSYTGVVATQVGISLGIRGPAICASTACTSSTDSIGMALLQIRAGIIDRAIIGGTEAPLTPILFAAFDRLGIMSRSNDNPERASRPFAEDRDGFVLSEGAASCVVESEEAAAARGARPIVEIASYTATSDAFHPFSPLPSGEEGIRAVRMALEQAGVGPEAVEYVSAHAVGSRANDPVELDVIRSVFGEGVPRVPISAIKSMTGHTMGAAGALQLVACALTIQTSTIAPTTNLGITDRVGGFDLVPEEARCATVRVAVSPTFGFGSRNAVLVVKRYEP